MGSLPKGTLCIYCRKHEASYIIDGFCGPMCMGFKHSCWTLCETVGWQVVVNRRWYRLWSARIGMVMCSQNGRTINNTFNDEVIGTHIASFFVLWLICSLALSWQHQLRGFCQIRQTPRRLASSQPVRPAPGAVACFLPFCRIASLNSKTFFPFG